MRLTVVSSRFTQASADPGLGRAAILVCLPEVSLELDDSGRTLALDRFSGCESSCCLDVGRLGQG